MRLYTVFARLSGSLAEDLPHLLVVGQRVTVLDTEGKRFKGEVLEVAPGRLVLQGDQPQRFSADRIAAIDGPGDRLLNGMLIGAAVGVGGGLIGASSQGENNSDTVVPFLAFGVGVGLGGGVR